MASLRNIRELPRLVAVSARGRFRSRSPRECRTTCRDFSTRRETPEWVLAAAWNSATARSAAARAFKRAETDALGHVIPNIMNPIVAVISAAPSGARSEEADATALARTAPLHNRANLI